MLVAENGCGLFARLKIEPLLSKGGKVGFAYLVLGSQFDGGV